MLGAIQQPMILPALVTCALPSNYLRSLNKKGSPSLYKKCAYGASTRTKSKIHLHLTPKPLVVMSKFFNKFINKKD